VARPRPAVAAESRACVRCNAVGMASILGRRQLFSRYIILIYKGEQNELDNLANVDIVFFNHAHLCERSQYNVRPLISYAQSRVFMQCNTPH